MDTGTERLIRNDEAGRYELVIDGTVASFADFTDTADGVRVFPHTVTDPVFRGRGLAAEVVRFALDDTRAAGRLVQPACWFVTEFIETNADYGDLVAGRP